MTEVEKEGIEYLKARLYGNKGCKYIDVAQEELRRIIKLVEIKEKSLKQADDLITEQDEEICKINNEKCDLEFKIDRLQKELDKKDKVIDLMAEDRAEISEPRVSKEAIINYYFKKVEEENETN